MFSLRQKIQLIVSTTAMLILLLILVVFDLQPDVAIPLCMILALITVGGICMVATEPFEPVMSTDTTEPPEIRQAE